MTAFPYLLLLRKPFRFKQIKRTKIRKLWVKTVPRCLQVCDFCWGFFSLIHFIFVVKHAAQGFQVEINEDNPLLQIEVMTIVCLEVFLLLFVYPLAAHTEDERSSFFSVRRNAAFWGNDGILRSEKTAGLMSCARLCSKEALCSVANFDEKR